MDFTEEVVLSDLYNFSTLSESLSLLLSCCFTQFMHAYKDMGQFLNRININLELSSSARQHTFADIFNIYGLCGLCL